MLPRPTPSLARWLHVTSAMTAASLLASPAFALPQSGDVVAGQATITTSPTQTTITQTTSRGIIHWQNFDVAHGEQVLFQQPSPSAITLNRVTGGGNASQIMGQISANGTVMLVNPNGVIFGPTAQVNVGSLVATTADIDNDRFMAGDLRFDKPGNPNATIVNQGTITVADAGLAALVAPNVLNNGVIQARLGKVTLASGDKFTLDLYGDGLIQLEASEAIQNQLVNNSGIINATGGKITLTAAAAADAVNSLINTDGIIEADSLTEHDGEIILGGSSSPITQPGRVQVAGQVSSRRGRITVAGDVVDLTGSLDTSHGGSITLAGRNIAQQGQLHADEGGQITARFREAYLDNESSQATARGGGSIQLLGDAGSRAFLSGLYDVDQNQGIGGHLAIQSSTVNLYGARLHASGSSGGGTILVGGEYQGGSGLMAATSTVVNGASTLTANATDQGDGGRIIVWAEERTRFAGTATARGGSAYGDGGFIEISGREQLTIHHDLARVDASAPVGQAGTVLFDPKNITISNSGLTGGGNPSLFELVDPNPAVGNFFGSGTVALSTGNIVVTSSGDDFAATNAGAVYLFNGATGGLISTLRGSGANQFIGSELIPLTNGNFVIRSTLWANGSATNAGAVTWGSGTSGISGTISATNSLVGSATNDVIGNGGVFALSNGHYVVRSQEWNSFTGAVTWGNGSTGTTGVVSAANSLVGSTPGNAIGNGGVVTLTNGNYVVRSPFWSDGAVTFAGAVTWGNGNTGISGTISSANSLIGSSVNDQIGLDGVTALTNGHYVVVSRNWDDGATIDLGAVTWGNGITGTVGVVSAANSLVGSTSSDAVNLSVRALTNGNYVAIWPSWRNGSAWNAGAVTWGDGTTGITGTISAANSLVGNKINDRVGSDGVTALTNGNYVVNSSNWNNGVASGVGAVTWGNGSTGTTGIVTAATSLVGTKNADRIGVGGVTALTNGNYVVNSWLWGNGTASSVGAVTWGDGSTGTTGAVSSANSIVGSTAIDRVGIGGITALTSGHYVIHSPNWDRGAITDAGAVTWGNGSTGTSGVVSAANSLVGSTASDQVGSALSVALTNGNYVVRSPNWDHGTVVNAGAATWGNGTTGITGAVSAANSLVGSTANDQVAITGVTALTNGNYVVRSANWGFGTIANAGAATWGNGSTGTTGVVSAANSLVGTTANDQVGSGAVQALANGHYVVISPNWDHGVLTNAGATTWGNGSTGITGLISANNSVVGPSSSAGLAPFSVPIDLPNGTYITRFSSAGRIHVSSMNGPQGGTPLSDYDGFHDSASASVNLAPSFLLGVLNTGTSVVLQASNDIVVQDAITANNPGGSGGSLTLQAGRSVLLNASITTDDGNLTVIGNDLAANGVIDTHRDPGDAVITLSSGVSINAGTGNVRFELRNGAGKTQTGAGNLTLRSITARNIFAQNANVTGDIVLASGTTMTATDSSTAITLISARDFINMAGAGALVTPTGRWLIFSSDPANNSLGGLSGDFNLFSCQYGGSCPSIPATGRGLLYRATSLNSPTLSNGSISSSVQPDTARIVYAQPNVPRGNLAPITPGKWTASPLDQRLVTSGYQDVTPLLYPRKPIYNLFDNPLIVEVDPSLQWFLNSKTRF